MTSAHDADAATLLGTLTGTATVHAANQPDGRPDDHTSADITVQASDVDATLTADQSSISGGDRAGFTVTLTNTGPGDAEGALLFDALPAGQGADLTWAIDQGAGDPSAFTITGSPGQQLLLLAPGLSTLAPGRSLLVHVSAATTSHDAPVLNNSALVDASNESDSERDKVVSATIAISVPAIVVTQVADRAGINAGEPAGFTITVTSQTFLNVVTVSDPLPAGLGNDVNWQIDPSIGDASAFQIMGAVGSQVLTQAPGVLVLGLGQTLTVHVTGVTSGNDADAGTFQGTLTSTAAVNYGSSLNLVQSAQAGTTISAPDVDVSVAADSASIDAGGASRLHDHHHQRGTGDRVRRHRAARPAAGAGNDIAWGIDAGTGNPAAWAISGAVGQQTLSLCPGSPPWRPWPLDGPHHGRDDRRPTPRHPPAA